MAPAARSERRNRKGVSSKGATAQAEAPLSPREIATKPCEEEEVEEVRAATQGISILKEIFPDHDVEASECAAAPSKEGPLLQNILGSVPSPARAPFGQVNSTPFGPPSHTPMPMVAPVGPPPPPLMPAPVCQDQWEGARATGPLLAEPAFGNYRERLRAGGRGAFQRAIDAGFVPKNMKQEWGAMQMSSANAQGMLSSAADVHSGGNMSYGVGDSQQMWGGAGQMAGSDYCGVALQQQYSQDYCGMQMQAPPTPDMMPMGQQIAPPMSTQTPLMLPQMAVQQPMQQQMQMMPMQGDQSPMQMAQMSMPVTPMAVPQTPTTASGDTTPVGIDHVQRECMAILMPQTSQFPCDKDILAAQLKASADCQRYED